MSNFPPSWQAGWYVIVSHVSFGRVGHFFFFFVEANGSCYGVPWEPPRDPTRAHVVFHGRPYFRDVSPIYTHAVRTQNVQ